MITCDMRQEQLHVEVHDEDGSYWAEVDKLPGCFASGHDVPELIDSVREAIALYLAPEGRAPARVAAENARLELSVPAGDAFSRSEGLR